MMSDARRLSERIGIERDRGDGAWMNWLTHAVLALLGGVILWIAFRFLRTEDPRWLYNPWSYALVTPVLLLVISLVLRQLVSRVVERSAQIAFLLSIVIHLVLLVAAVNVVIYSRMWPDFFEELASERKAMQDRPQAPQYYKVTSASQGGKRPEYLRYVPTQHQPTELPPVDAAMLQLARSERADVASPSPQLEVTAQPFLMEREKVEIAPAVTSADSAALSRAELAHRAQRFRQIETLEELPVAESSAAELAPAESQRSRGSRGGNRGGASQAATRSDSSNETSSAASSAVAFLAQPHLPDTEATGLPQMLAQNTPRVELQRRQSQTIPQPSRDGGELPRELQRSAAGGITGAAAPLSLPVRGVPELAAPESPVGDTASALSSLAERGSRRTRPASSLPEVGLSQAPAWAGDVNLNQGVAGAGRAHLPERSELAEAPVSDVARLSGAGTEILPSALGMAARDAALLAGDATSDAASSVEGVPGNAPAPASGAAGGRNLESLLRSPTEGAGPRVAVPETLAGTGGDADSAEPPSGGTLANAAGSARRQRPQRESAPLALNIDALPGVGGLAPTLSTGPLLARNTPQPTVTPFADLDSQRFSRQEFGGPLAAGNPVPVPKPAFQQRLERLKDQELGADGLVGPQTELAIERGLEFLARNQRPDGAWRLQDLDGGVLIRSDTAATGLALLAFQGAGYTHQQYKYAEAVHRAWAYLLDRQQPNGDLYIPQDPASDQNAWLYSHAIATLALCEAYGMTQDARLREPAERAVRFMVNSQDPQRGGWRYRPGVGSDTSVSGWFMMALKSAQLAGIDVPQPTFVRLSAFVDASQAGPQQPHLYRYNPFALDTVEQRHGLQPTPVMTSVGLLMRLYLGWRRDLPAMQAGADRLLEYPPQLGTPEASLRDTYYWYYATQVMFHMGGERWKAWHSRLHPLLIDSQVTSGDLSGSWDPNLPTPDIWARFAGRHYVTTMNLLSLEVNYRHLPLYDAAAR
jgi:hypothetical protein